ncbi:uncharacterized protein LOC144544097 [Carex rostrata]
MDLGNTGSKIFMTEPRSMVPLFLLPLIFLLILGAAPCSARHVININSSTLLKFSSLAWDPTAQHFVVGSAMSPTVYAIGDDGMVKCLLSEPPSNRSGVSVTALAVDQIRLRLIVAFSNPPSISTYDLKSYERIYTVSLPELDGAPSGVVVNLESGEVFVSSARRMVVLKVGPYGDTLQEFVLSTRIKLLNNISNNQTLTKRIISELNISSDEGLGGILYLSDGYILVLQTTTGKIFKVNTIDGTMKEILLRDSLIPLTPPGHAMALLTEKFIVVTTNHSVLLIKSDENSWARAAIMTKMKMKEGEMAVAVAMREEKKLYVLVNSQKGYRLEEAVFKRFPFIYWCFFLGVIPLCALPLFRSLSQHSKDNPFGEMNWKRVDWELMNWRNFCNWFLKR